MDKFIKKYNKELELYVEVINFTLPQRTLLIIWIAGNLLQQVVMESVVPSSNNLRL